jgi:membrane protein YdbS with pleckstrin-like domain
MGEPARWYPSKVDTWIAVVLCLAPVVTIGSTILTVVAGEGLVIGLGTIVFLAALYFGLLLPMRYGITGEHIVVRHGLVRQKIPLAEITDVSPTRNPLSSPALSLDRLSIRWGEGYTKNAMISPADKQAFLNELAERAGLERDGDKLYRRRATGPV